MEFKIQPRIETLSEKKLAGLKMKMSLAENKTAELWRLFMPRRNQFSNRINNDFISMQIYPANYFLNFNISTKFEKWAAVEVSNFDNLPGHFESFTVPAGLYVVFHHKGMDTGIFHTIFTDWIPNSGYELDDRPHFEILGEKYINGSPDSEEDIWIPIKPKKK